MYLGIIHLKDVRKSMTALATTQRLALSSAAGRLRHNRHNYGRYRDHSPVPHSIPRQAVCLYSSDLTAPVNGPGHSGHRLTRDLSRPIRGQIRRCRATAAGVQTSMAS